MAAKQGEFKPTTKSGYALDELVSALQKCIRRGMEEEALFFAYEMAEGYDDYLWRRLLIIASEDIGIADNFAAVLVGQLYANSRVVIGSGKKQELADSEQIAHAVLYLCRTQKNRYVDDYANYVALRRERGWRPEIPDFALDQHTERGRELGRGEPHFCQHGTVVEPKVEVGGKDYWQAFCKLCSSAPRCPVRR